MFLIAGALFDPLTEGDFFGSRKSFVGLRRRHLLVFVIRSDPAPKFTFLQVSGLDGHRATLRFASGALWGIESKFGLSSLGVESVTGEAFIRKDGADIAVK